MDEKAVKRRNWVKNIAIIFLAVMLVLTLFSNTIMNYSLPQVAAQYCSNGSITTRIRANGTVEAKETYQVTAPTGMASAIVKAVGVKTGTAVTTDTVLFTLEDTQEQDIIAATQKLASLMEEYNAILKETGGVDDSDLKQQIADKQAAISEAQAKRYAASAAKSQLEAMNIEYRDAEKQNNKDKGRLEKVNASIAAIEAALDGNDGLADSLSAAQADFDAKTAALENARQKLSSAEQSAESAAQSEADASDALERFEAENEANSSITEKTLIEQRRALKAQQLAYDEQLQNYYNTLAEIDKYKAMLANAEAAANSAWAAAQNAPEEDKEAMLEVFYIRQQEHQDAIKAYDDAKSDIDKRAAAQWYALQKSELDLAYAKEDLESNEAIYQGSYTYSARLRELQDQLKAAQSNNKDAAKAVEAAKKELETAQSEYDASKSMLKTMEKADSTSLSALISEQEQLETAIEHFNDYYSAQYSDFQVKLSELAATAADTVTDSTLNALKSELTKLQNQLSDSQTVDSSANEVSALKLEAKSKEIENQQALIDKIQAGDYTQEIYSPVDGIVSSVNISAGNEVSLNSIMAEIQIVDRGFMSSFKVTSEQAKRIPVGSSADVSYWWGSDIKANVVSITPDPDSPNSSRIVKLDIIGDVSVGTNLSFTIGEKSQSYESVVPNNAIREDNNGKFVLVVQAKATPLSTRYTAQRIDIEVIASDDTSTAVTGISYGDYVIITSSKPVTSGMQVRLNENG